MADLLPLNPDELLTTTRAVRKRLDLTRPWTGRWSRSASRSPCRRRRAPTGRRGSGSWWTIRTRSGAGRDLPERVRPYSRPRRRPAEGDTRAQRKEAVNASALHLRDHYHEVPVLLVAFQLGLRTSCRRIPPGLVGIGDPGRVELHARPAGPGHGLGLDDDDLSQGGRGRRRARRAAGVHAHRDVPRRLHGRHGLQARAPAGPRRRHPLEPAGRGRRAGWHGRASRTTGHRL